MNKSPAKLAEAFLTNRTDDPTTYSLNEAVLYGVTQDGDFHRIAGAPDVYDLLDSKHDLTLNGSAFIGIAIHTCGWAAPLNADGGVEGAPSQHPQRRRVALIACVSYDSMGSALSFQDEPTEIVTDEGQATGSLADALMGMWKEQGHPF
jgi:hypothetical protein